MQCWTEDMTSMGELITMLDVSTASIAYSLYLCALGRRKSKYDKFSFPPTWACAYHQGKNRSSELPVSFGQ